MFTGGGRTQSNNVTAYCPAVIMIVLLKDICHLHQLHRWYLIQSNFTQTFFHMPCPLHNSVFKLRYYCFWRLHLVYKSGNNQHFCNLPTAGNVCTYFKCVIVNTTDLRDKKLNKQPSHHPNRVFRQAMIVLV